MVHATVLAHQERLSALEADNDFPSDIRALLDFAVEHHSDTFLLNFFDQDEQRDATQLRDDAYRLAHGMLELGIGHGHHVAVRMSNRIEFAISWLAIQILGAVVVPVNTASTDTELEHHLKDADVGFLLQEASGPGSAILLDDTAWADVLAAGDPHWRPDYPTSAGDVATIQYTSGSTGLPKGCMLTQGSWILFGCSPVATSNIRYDNILCGHPWFYVDPGWHLVMALYSGARLHMAEALSGSKFVDRVRKWNIDFCLFPRPLVGQDGEASDRDLPLKVVAALGASPGALAQIEERFGCRAINPFGMTEIGVGLRLPDDCDDPTAIGSCGVPALFREVRIVAADGELAGVGEPGELQIRGESLFAGYYKSPEADSEAFVDDWFRTGDLFTVDEHGYYWIVGRLKDIIRRSSQNISALEVEQTLTACPGVHQAAVVSVPDQYRGEEAKAFVLLDADANPELVPPTKILDHCRASLSAFKVPRFVIYVDEFPYTASSKISKPELLAGIDDQRSGCWDDEQKDWLP